MSVSATLTTGDPPAAGPSGAESAKQALRDTGKWLFGGVAATAAGVLAGTSLTNIGSLDPHDDLKRLLAAVAGLALAFAGLGWLARRAITLLTIERFDLRQLAKHEARLSGRTWWKLPYRDRVLREMLEQVKAQSPSRFGNGQTLTDFADKVDAAKGSQKPKAQNAVDELGEDASFIWVQTQFRKMTTALFPATFAVAVGLTVFAWAANPPKRSEAKNRNEPQHLSVLIGGPAIAPPPPAAVNEKLTDGGDLRRQARPAAPSDGHPPHHRSGSSTAF